MSEVSIDPAFRKKYPAEAVEFEALGISVYRGPKGLRSRFSDGRWILPENLDKYLAAAREARDEREAMTLRQRYEFLRDQLKSNPPPGMQWLTCTPMSGDEGVWFNRAVTIKLRGKGDFRHETNAHQYNWDALDAAFDAFEASLGNPRPVDDLPAGEGGAG